MSEVSKFGESLSEFIRGVMRAAGPLAPRQVDPTPDVDEFPPSGIDVVHHMLRVRLDVGATGEGDEIVVLFGKMVIARGEPFVNGDGRRQVDFEVRSWEASGWSWTLKQVLTYVLAEDEKQPTSSIVAEEAESDFPATFNFNVVFDVRADNTPVFRRQHGKPEGHGFLAVPPNGERRMSPRITKFEDTRVRVDHPVLGTIEAIPIDCNDLGSMTLATF